MKKIKSLTNECSQKIISLIKEYRRKIISLVKEHKKIVLIEVAILVIYGCIASLVINDNKKYLEIFFSSEVLVSLLIAAGAVYSWIYYKSISDSEIADREYESDLKLLHNIDDLINEYQDKNLELELYENSELPTFVENIENQYKDEKSIHRKFLNIYYKYIRNKVRPSDELDSASGNQNKYLNKIKSAIRDKFQLGDIKQVRYSKNYKEADFLWSTWYSLDKKLIENINAEQGRFIFVVKVDEEYKGVDINAGVLLELVEKMKIKNSKTGKKIYDFHIRKKSDDTFYESLNGIELSEFGMKELDLEFLKDEKML